MPTGERLQQHLNENGDPGVRVRGVLRTCAKSVALYQRASTAQKRLSLCLCCAYTVKRIHIQRHIRTYQTLALTDKQTYTLRPARR